MTEQTEAGERHYWKFEGYPHGDLHWCHISHRVMEYMVDFAVSKRKPGFGGVLLGSSCWRGADIETATDRLDEFHDAGDEFCGMFFLGPVTSSAYHQFCRMRDDFREHDRRGIVFISLGSDPSLEGWIRVSMVTEERSPYEEEELPFDVESRHPDGWPVPQARLKTN